MDIKKYLTLDSLAYFIAKLRNNFAAISHKHDIEDITDYAIDTELSSDSTGPVQNKVINAAILSTKSELEEEMVGEKTTGNIFTIDSSQITAAEGSEIFNAYNENIATGKYSHAENYLTTAKGSYSHAEGYQTFTNGAASHAEGYDTKATARYAHAEGASTTASGNNSHAEGNNTVSSGHYSHAEGNNSVSEGDYSHAEGESTHSIGVRSHAEGNSTIASATGAHSEGNYTVSNGIYSHAEGYYTSAQSAYQHVRGKYNIPDTDGVYSTIIGNGEGESSRRNIHTLDWNGNSWFSGRIKIGGTGQNDDSAQVVATMDDLGEYTELSNEDIDALFVNI